MFGLTRSLPRRRAARYPIGSTLKFRDGRVFEVRGEEYEYMDSNPWDFKVHVGVRRFWKEVLNVEHTD